MIYNGPHPAHEIFEKVTVRCSALRLLEEATTIGPN